MEKSSILRENRFVFVSYVRAIVLCNIEEKCTIKCLTLFGIERIHRNLDS